ncbi:MAG TPA: UPF0280 family protein [Firmicutes bacterium]|nr:UPF0280 family protein [Bacillota bacterium]
MSSRRVYRRVIAGQRFISFTVTVKETDLFIAVLGKDYYRSLSGEIENLVWQQRREIEAYISRHPDFKTTCRPYLADNLPPGLVLRMIQAGNRAGVGPMAAVAGALAEFVGNSLLQISTEVIVENGGDIFIKVVEPVAVGIFAGKSPLSGKVAISVEPGQTPLGVCTSSGTVGHALSLGKADAAVALSPSAALADAAATALANRVRDCSDLQPALEFARSLEGLSGAVIICDDKLAAWGAVKLCPAGL